MPAQKFGIDPDKVSQVSSKVRLYTENEEKYIMDIVTALSELSSAYEGSSTKDGLNEKIQFITTLLYVLLENRKDYVRCLNDAVSSYQTQNAYFMKGFNQMTQKFY